MPVPKPRPEPKPRTKIRPFRKVPISRVKNRDPRFVYLENERYGIKVPLQNEHGLLQGVFETSVGKILEVRLMVDSLRAYIGKKRVGVLRIDLRNRRTEPAFRRQGIASELFDLVGTALDALV